jgi:hypothetical protein
LDNHRRERLSPTVSAVNPEESFGVGQGAGDSGAARRLGLGPSTHIGEIRQGWEIGAHELRQ